MAAWRVGRQSPTQSRHLMTFFPTRLKAPGTALFSAASARRAALAAPSTRRRIGDRRGGTAARQRALSVRQPSSPRSSSCPAATFLYRQSDTKTRRDGHRAAASPEADRTRAASPAADDAPRHRRRLHHSRRLSRAHVRASHAFLRLAFLQLLYAFQGLVRRPRASPIGSEAASRISLNYSSSHGPQIRDLYFF